MYLSISQTKSLGFSHQKKFTVKDVKTLPELSAVMTDRVWSPIVWKNGDRASANFQEVSLCVLDFDDGQWSVDDAKDWVLKQNYSAVIGTTKSHLKQKGSEPPKHRFRLALVWQSTITSKDSYTHSIRLLAETVPCDKQALDAARTFHPCKEIYFTQKGEFRVPWYAYTPPPPRPPSIYVEKGIMPPWLRALCVYSPPPGSRNAHVFKLAAALAKHGFSLENIHAKIAEAPIDLSEKEKKHAAESGYRAERRGKS